MDICIDFDGTCVSHEFPLIGKDIGAIPVLKELVEAGHKLILFTMRSDRKKKKKVDGETIVVEENFLVDALQVLKSEVRSTLSPAFVEVTIVVVASVVTVVLEPSFL